MGTITTKDGAQIYYKDWGRGQPIVFSHSWPLSADDWDAQTIFFASRGFRGIAHDRRGHGRSTQTWDGNEMDTYAADLVALTEALDLKNAVHVGHSTGGGEVARYIGRHGAGRMRSSRPDPWDGRPALQGVARRPRQSACRGGSRGGASTWTA